MQNYQPEDSEGKEASMRDDPRYKHLYLDQSKLEKITKDMSAFIETNEGNPNIHDEHYLGKAVYLGTEAKNKLFGVELAGVNCAAHNAEVLKGLAKSAGLNQDEMQFLVGAAKLNYGDAEKYLQEHGPFSVSYDKAKRLFQLALEPYVRDTEDYVNKYFIHFKKPKSFGALPLNIQAVIVDSMFWNGGLKQYIPYLKNYTDDSNLNKQLVQHCQKAITDGGNKMRIGRKIQLLQGKIKL